MAALTVRRQHNVEAEVTYILTTYSTADCPLNIISHIFPITVIGAGGAVGTNNADATNGRGASGETRTVNINCCRRPSQCGKFVTMLFDLFSECRGSWWRPRFRCILCGHSRRKISR